ncbi:MAG: hypothetical protein M1816_006817 [Peltula sp. TS41687]|nr:MAG: hypothetical protein M1816_006817 [Peltula sp. TS41687]
MASIFTFEAEPPRVSSPWLKADADAAGAGPAPTAQALAPSGPDSAQLAASGITKLAAEPQEGPTEYKLHLLLRPRRKYTSSTTGTYTAGSQRSSGVTSYDPSSPRQLEGMSPNLAPSTQSRQTRLQQLTTQLLWRLQQSLPHHSSSATNGVSHSKGPLDPRLQRGGLLPGLEESHGALYEIGVSDEGTCVGLTQDELDESLETLQVMAQSLGCAVHVMRLVMVGSCEWIEPSKENPKQPEQLCKGKLWVAEALVKPDLENSDSGLSAEPPVQPLTTDARGGIQTDEAENEKSSIVQPEQLRVSFTGSTNSGKSSLLGTLSSSALDNSRGRSRLCLLRHRHELESGLTSSVAHELIGYKPAHNSAVQAAAEVVNYASGNVSSWTDIHVSSQCTRLVFFSDSAGHPRYRRTAIRGLVGWAPHWTALCIAADGKTDMSPEPNSLTQTKDTSLSSTTGLGVSNAHMKLCQDLEMPLIVIVTKLDVASTPTLKSILGSVLSGLKSAGRKPIMIPTRGSGGRQAKPKELQTISDRDEADVEQAIEKVREYGPKVAVPVILTSAVQGVGIASIHALFNKLPIPSPVDLSTMHEVGPLGFDLIPALFHIEDVFALPSSFAAQFSSNLLEGGSVISGHLSHGHILVGEELLLGPFPVDEATEGLSIGDDGKPRQGKDSADKDIGYVCGSAMPAVTAFSQGGSVRSRGPQGWRRVRVVSIRNLRLPTSKLLSGQVGSIGLVQPPTRIDQTTGLEGPGTPSNPSQAALSTRIRKGMVLARFGNSNPRSFGGFVGLFHDFNPSTLNENCPVTVYFASVRATAKISNIRVISRSVVQPEILAGAEQVPGLDPVDYHQADDGMTNSRSAEITFCFLGCREWFEIGVQVLAMPSSAGNSSGASDVVREGAGLLEGFVGRIIRATL